MNSLVLLHLRSFAAPEDLYRTSFEWRCGARACYVEMRLDTRRGTYCPDHASPRVATWHARVRAPRRVGKVLGARTGLSRNDTDGTVGGGGLGGRRRPWACPTGLLAIFTALLSVASAHDVPDQVSIQAFLKPEGNRMVAVVRIPTKALLDVEFPELRGIGYLDLNRVDAPAQRASRLWVANVVELYENGARLPRPTILKYRLSRESDASFASYATAVARINDPPIPSSEFVRWDRSVLDVLLDTPIHSDRSTFSLQPRWGRLGLRVNTRIVFVPAEGRERNFAYEGDPSRYTLNPTINGAAAHFLYLGAAQILARPDPLLFLFALVLVFRRFSALRPVFVIFALASASALIVFEKFSNPLLPFWFPSLIRLLSAAAILYVAAESLLPSMPERCRWVTVAISGMVFGTGFWFELEPVLQFGGSHSTVSIWSFGAGLALAEIAAIALLIPVVDLYFRIAGPAKINVMILAGLTAHVAWHELVDRAAALKLWTAAAPAFKSANQHDLAASVIDVNLLKDRRRQ